MRQEISFNEIIFVLIGFVLGSSIIIVPGLNVKNNTWIVVAVSTFIGLVLIYFYITLSRLNDGKSIIEICLDRLGPIFGSIIALCYVWYFYHLGVLVLKNFIEYESVVRTPETPQSFIGIFFVLLAASLVRNGIEVIVKFSQFFMPFVIILTILIIMLLSNKMDFNNLKPIFPLEITKLLKGIFITSTFPFGEIIALTSFFPFVNLNKKSILFGCITIYSAGTLLTVITIVVILVLGPLASEVTFPTFTTVQTINIYDFIERIEMISSFSLIVTTMIKVSVCLFATSVGIAHIFKFNNYQVIVIPLAILMLNLSLFIYDNITEMFTWATEIYPFYAIPFQFLIPGLLFILTILDKNKKTTASSRC